MSFWEKLIGRDQSSYEAGQQWAETFIEESGDGAECYDPNVPEPTLVKCPYCFGHHYIGQIELCPLNLHRKP